MSNREESEIDIYSEQKDSKIYMYLDTLGNFDKSKLTKRKERLIRYEINKLAKVQKVFSTVFGFKNNSSPEK